LLGHFEIARLLKDRRRERSIVRQYECLSSQCDQFCNNAGSLCGSECYAAIITEKRGSLKQKMGLDAAVLASQIDLYNFTDLLMTNTFDILKLAMSNPTDPLSVEGT
jgi:hypothetical protein